VIQESRIIRLLITLQSEIQTVQSRIQASEEYGILILGQFVVSGMHNRSGIRIQGMHGLPYMQDRYPIHDVQYSFV
jgi:hypothetical protein